MTYMKAVEAGCDIIDTAMSPFALGTSQPATEVMVEAFKGTQYDTGLDQNKLAEIADYFRPMREEALDSGLMNPKVLGVNIKTLLYQVPGGMLSNLISQLKEQGQEDKYEEVLAEVPRVRKDLGEPPLVTPSSQIVGTQAVFNVLMGERYKVATKETKDILLGKYGQTVKPFNPEVVDKVLGADKDKAITCRPADLLEPELDKIEAEMKQYKQQDEDVLSYALFPQVATEFFKYRQAQQTKVDTTIADTKNGAYPVQYLAIYSSKEAATDKYVCSCFPFDGYNGISELHKNSMDKRTKDCYDEVMICHGGDKFNCKAFENIVAVLSRYLEREKVKDNETV